MARRLDGKVCVITGAGGGMGREAAVVFTAEGAEVCLADVSREAAEETGWRPVGYGREVITFEPLPGGVATRVHVHLWTDAEESDEPLDRHEPGTARWVPLADVPSLAAAGELLAAGTLVALLMYLSARGSSGPRTAHKP